MVEVATKVGASVVEEFERRVDIERKRVAVRACGGTADVTYLELDCWANAIAADLLARRGDNPEPVPLLIGSAAHMLAAALGVLKAGKYYVPINPGHPAARVQGLLDELAAPVVLDDDAVERIVANAGAARRPGLRFDPDRIAYVIYTSGSTGRPRGVAMSRGNMLHNVGRHNALGVGRADCVTLLTADGFVTSVSNPYVTLLRGGTLAPFAFKDDGVDGMMDWLAATGVTVFYGFPSFLRQLAALTPPGREYPGMRLVYLGGETVLPADLAAARRLFPKAGLSTGLNSTETGLTCLHLVSAGSPLPDPVPVGKPVAGVDVVVLDDTDEIEIRSAHVRPRYWRSDGFEDVADEVEPGTYAFRTGDRGRIGDNGEVYHLGRLDGMVKVRGFRVETTEVEAAIAAIDGVTDVAVVPIGEDASTAELRAYVVGTDLTPATIRGGVATALPSAMIPAKVVVLDALPRMANGKIDRRALAAFDAPAAAPASRVPGAKPTGERAAAETRVAAIWRSVLDVADVKADDDFFALGGTSISAVTVIARVRADLQAQLPLAVLFETPTVAAIADAALRLRPADAPPLVRSASTDVEVRPATAADWTAAVAADEGFAAATLRHPSLVAVVDGEVVGVAYARSWQPGTEYDTCAEVEVHVAPDARRTGIGTALYDRLLGLLDAQGFRTTVATIALPDDAAVALHESFGFHWAGTLTGVETVTRTSHDVGLWFRAAPGSVG